MKDSTKDNEIVRPQRVARRATTYGCACAAPLPQPQTITRRSSLPIELLPVTDGVDKPQPEERTMIGIRTAATLLRRASSGRFRWLEEEVTDEETPPDHLFSIDDEYDDDENDIEKGRQDEETASLNDDSLSAGSGELNRNESNNANNVEIGQASETFVEIDLAYVNSDEVMILEKEKQGASPETPDQSTETTEEFSSEEFFEDENDEPDNNGDDRRCSALRDSWAFKSLLNLFLWIVFGSLVTLVLIALAALVTRNSIREVVQLYPGLCFIPIGVAKIFGAIDTCLSCLSSSSRTNSSQQQPRRRRARGDRRGVRHHRLATNV